jgi:hypothetical protein
MALIELNLEKPALKRTETAESSAKKSTGTAPGETSTETSTSEKSTTEKSGEGTSMVEMPEGESVEEKSSGGGILRRLTMLGATAGAVFAVRRWRSRRKQGAGESAEFEEEWETPSSE